jgi:hypothetical protein
MTKTGKTHHLVLQEVVYEPKAWLTPLASVSTVYPGDITVIDDGLIPVKNFGRVMEGVYRSSFPLEENLPFLKILGLKTILYVFFRGPDAVLI